MWRANPAFRPVAKNDALESKGFFRSLYDLSFSSFITLRVARFFYGLFIVLWSLEALVGIGVLIGYGTRLHLPTAAAIGLALVGVPIVYFIGLITVRLSYESLMVIFNLGKDLRSIRERFDTKL